MYTPFDFPDVFDDGLLYFHKMAGAGLISCNTCDFSEEIISFLHNLGTNGKSSIQGYQCQVCGKFHEIKSVNGSSKNIDLCDCGGLLAYDKHVFCPSCKGKNLRYLLHYIT